MYTGGCGFESDSNHLQWVLMNRTTLEISTQELSPSFSIKFDFNSKTSCWTTLSATRTSDSNYRILLSINAHPFLEAEVIRFSTPSTFSRDVLPQSLLSDLEFECIKNLIWIAPSTSTPLVWLPLGFLRRFLTSICTIAQTFHFKVESLPSCKMTA